MEVVMRIISKSDFYETPSGQVKIKKHLAHELAQTIPLWMDGIAPVVERAASILLSEKVPKRLTKANRRRKVRTKKSRKVVQSPELPTLPALPFVESGPAALKQMREKNIDPAHGGDAARKRGASNRARANERKAWGLSHSPGEYEAEQAKFIKEIQPAIQRFTLTQISQATGLSPRYASLIRSGKCIPHPVHNPKLMELINPTELKG
jgi:hypothetical protein